MDKEREIFRLATDFVRIKYREAAYAAGIKNGEFRDWAQSMGGMGVALAWNKEAEFNPARGSFATYALFKTKEAVRASLRDHHRYAKAKKALSEVLTEPNSDTSAPYLSREEALQVLELLTADQQRVIQLDYSGYGTEEITAIMKRKNTKAVYSLLRRARRKSRQIYREFSSLGVFPIRPKPKFQIGRSPPDDSDENGPLEIRL